MKITVSGPKRDEIAEIPNNTLDPRNFLPLAEVIGALVLRAMDYRGGNGDYDAGERSVRVTIDRVRSEYHHEYERWKGWNVSVKKGNYPLDQQNPSPRYYKRGDPIP